MPRHQENTLQASVRTASHRPTIFIILQIIMHNLRNKKKCITHIKFASGKAGLLIRSCMFRGWEPFHDPKLCHKMVVDNDLLSKTGELHNVRVDCIAKVPH